MADRRPRDGRHERNGAENEGEKPQLCREILEREDLEIGGVDARQRYPDDKLGSATDVDSLRRGGRGCLDEGAKRGRDRVLQAERGRVHLAVVHEKRTRTRAVQRVEEHQVLSVVRSQFGDDLARVAEAQADVGILALRERELPGREVREPRHGRRQSQGAEPEGHGEPCARDRVPPRA